MPIQSKKPGIDLIHWQHIGNGQFTNGRVYKSKRVVLNQRDDMLFDLKSNPDKYFDSYLGLGIHCSMPLIVLKDSIKTYPLTKNKSFLKLQKDIHNIRLIPINNLIQNPELIIGNLVNLWNSIQHFYPYFKHVNSTRDSIFTQMLNDCLGNKGELSFINSI